MPADPGTPNPTPLGRPSLGGQAIPTCPLPQVPTLLPRRTWAPQTHPPSENTGFHPFSSPSWGGAWGGGMPPEPQEIFWKQSQIFLGWSNKSWSDCRKSFVPKASARLSVKQLRTAVVGTRLKCRNTAGPTQLPEGGPVGSQCPEGRDGLLGLFMYPTGLGEEGRGRPKTILSPGVP